MLSMERERFGSPAARWLQPDPVPFWATRIFRWNLVLCALALSGAAFYGIVIEPGLNAEARKKAEAATAAARYVPRDPASTAPKEVRFDGLLDATKDDLDPEVRDEPYRHLVRYLSKADPAMLAKQAKTVDYKFLMAHPEEVRGLTVRIHADFWKAPKGPERLEPPVGGVQTMTRVYLADPQAPKEVTFVDFVEAPPEIEPETQVVVDAVFLRRVMYERSDTPQYHQAPLLLARSIAKVQERPPGVGYRYRWLVVMMAVGLLAGLSLLTFRGWARLRSAAPPSSPTARRIPD
jgi:hypothetical protein